ncbi:tyrosine-type recombinase/integrase [Sandarakinorhabdus cyanobacteriorum]
MDLSKVSVRQSLKPAKEPHWQRLHEGCFLGFRPSKRGGTGTWIARAYDPDKQRYSLMSLGGYSDRPASEMFVAAKREAEAFAEQVRAGGVRIQKIETVADACRTYAADKPEAAERFERFVYNDPIANVLISNLRRHHLDGWRQRLSATPARVGRRKNGEVTSRTRAQSTVNRELVPLRAALRKAATLGKPGTDRAWQEALVPTPGADGQRTLYLDREQRRRLLQHIPDEAQKFFRALCLLPLRPGAMAALNVEDFTSGTNELLVTKDKNGRSRRILLPPDTAKLFQELALGKAPGTPMFVRPNGKRWDRDSWKRPIALAARAAELDEGLTAYTLRHSTITDLVIDGLPLLTIAQASGTSVQMIEKHYGHLRSDGLAKALAALAL